MKNRVQEDERILSEKRKIQSNGFQLVWIVLLVSALIQQYIYKAPIAQYGVEIMTVIAMSVYVLIANIVKGNDIFDSKERGRRIIIINSVVTGLTVSVINTTINYINYSDKIKYPVIMHIAFVAGITFICTAVFAYIILTIFYFFNNKKQQEIDEMLNDDDIRG